MSFKNTDRADKHLLIIRKSENYSYREGGNIERPAEFYVVQRTRRQADLLKLYLVVS